MVEQVEVAISGSRVTVRADYNPRFPGLARKLGGRFEGGLWLFDARDEDRVRALCVDVYGSDGRPVPKSALLTVRLTAPNGLRAGQGSVFLGGREIARATSKWSGAKIGRGVVFLEGGVASGGSEKYWQSEVRAGSVFEIRDLVPGVLEKIRHGIEERPELELSAEVIDYETAFDREALEAERSGLTGRLAEVDAVLAAHAPDDVAELATVS